MRTPVGRAELDRLAAGADILIATVQPGTPSADIFSYERLAALNPALIVVAVTPFGLTGPRAEWKASDVELMAAGGAMALAGKPDGAPRRISVPQSYPWTGSQAAIGALVAQNERNRSGKGQLVVVAGAHLGLDEDPEVHGQESRGQDGPGGPARVGRPPAPAPC